MRKFGEKSKFKYDEKFQKNTKVFLRMVDFK
jgi:hypothetical protein